MKVSCKLTECSDLYLLSYFKLEAFFLQPGRVLTLLPSEDKEDRVWGKVYEVDGAQDINAAIHHLAEREMNLGGYRFDAVSFYPLRCCEQDSELPRNVIRAFVYIAEPENDQYIGNAPLEIQVD